MVLDETRDTAVRLNGQVMEYTGQKPDESFTVFMVTDVFFFKQKTAYEITV